jgi:hypothetical protein
MRYELNKLILIGLRSVGAKTLCIIIWTGICQCTLFLHLLILFFRVDILRRVNIFSDSLYKFIFFINLVKYFLLIAKYDFPLLYISRCLKNEHYYRTSLCNIYIRSFLIVSYLKHHVFVSL